MKKGKVLELFLKNSKIGNDSNGEIKFMFSEKQMNDFTDRLVKKLTKYNVSEPIAGFEKVGKSFEIIGDTMTHGIPIGTMLQVIGIDSIMMQYIVKYNNTVWYIPFVDLNTD